MTSFGTFLCSWKIKHSIFHDLPEYSAPFGHHWLDAYHGPGIPKKAYFYGGIWRKVTNAVGKGSMQRGAPRSDVGEQKQHGWCHLSPSSQGALTHLKLIPDFESLEYFQKDTFTSTQANAKVKLSIVTGGIRALGYPGPNPSFAQPLPSLVSYLISMYFSFLIHKIQ